MQQILTSPCQQGGGDAAPADSGADASVRLAGRTSSTQLENSAVSNCRYGRKIPASNYLIQPENSAASNCRYGRKILASNYQIRPENSAYGNYRNGRKIPATWNIINVIAHHIQCYSGAVLKHLVHDLKVSGSRPPCAQILFRYTAGKFRWHRNLNKKFRPTC